MLGGEVGRARSPIPSGDSAGQTEQVTGHRHRHHHHHHSGERATGHQSRSADGYGHLNGDLIFIERGEHSPHRQTPPPGYEYKGKIEVQGADRERRSHSRGHTAVFPPQPPHVPIPQPVGPAINRGPCPPGWQQMVLSAAPGGPCPPCPGMFSGQAIGGGGYVQPGGGGYLQPGVGGFTGVGGTAASGGGLANLAAHYPIPTQGQIVADYIVGGGGGSAGGGDGGGGHSSTVNQQSGGGGGGFTEQL